MFKNLLIVENPASTHAARASSYVLELQRLLPNATVEHYKIATSKNRDTKKLGTKIAACKPGTLICVAAGDGTVGLVIEMLLLHAKATLPILPLWGGNANDLATMLGGDAPGSIAATIQQGSLVEIYPLQCTLTLANGTTKTRTAMCYASFGASAYAAKHLNTKQHRHNFLHRIPGYTPFSEMLAALNGMVQAPRFQVEEGAERYRVYEKLFTKGTRFAKRNIFPLHLTDKRFYTRTVLHKRPFHVFTHLGDMIRKSHAHAAIQQEPATFTCLSPTLAQFDGEEVQVPAGTRVIIGVHPKSITALSTLLPNREVVR